MTSMVTGITEPLEFTFLFVAPLLYAIHCVFAGLAYMIMHILDVGVGMTFSGGLIDMFLFGVLQGNGKTNWVWIPVVGIVYFIVYYVLFSFLIAKLDLKTPGRDDNEEVKLYRRSDVDARKQGAAGTADAEEDELSASICRGLGGKKNISDVDCCATRLRCTVHKSELVDDALLKSTGASGVVHKGNGVQVIYGPRVTVIKSNLEDYLEHAPEEEYLPKREAADKQTSDAKERSFLRPVKTEIICSPVSGLADEISKVPDEAFAGRMMGDGAMVIPKEQTVCAPADGEVCFVFDTKHAVGFETADHTALLLHMGIDTVNLGGTGFEVLVKAGDKVKKGDVLMKLDLQFIQANAPSLASPVLCTELSEHQKIRLLKTGDIQAGEPLFAVETYEE